MQWYHRQQWWHHMMPKLVPMESMTKKSHVTPHLYCHWSKECNGATDNMLVSCNTNAYASGITWWKRKKKSFCTLVPQPVVLT